jgi:hypothetical protein
MVQCRRVCTSRIVFMLVLSRRLFCILLSVLSLLLIQYCLKGSYNPSSGASACISCSAGLTIYIILMNICMWMFLAGCYNTIGTYNCMSSNKPSIASTASQTISLLCVIWYVNCEFKVIHFFRWKIILICKLRVLIFSKTRQPPFSRLRLLSFFSSFSFRV